MLGPDLAAAHFLYRTCVSGVHTGAAVGAGTGSSGCTLSLPQQLPSQIQVCASILPLYEQVLSAHKHNR
jgi:hypothetical protein